MKVKLWIILMIVVLALSSCIKDSDIPAGHTFSSNALVFVTTYPLVSNISQSTAETEGSVDVFGNTKITERGVCWNTSHNPTTSDAYAASGFGTGSFNCIITGLMAGTTYYFRAYAVNSKGTTYGEEESFTTKPLDGEFTITVSSDPTDGGIVYGGGNYHSNQTCTLAAIANEGYIFVDWKDYGHSVVSNNANYSFTVYGNRILVAEFMAKPQFYTVNVSANPSDGGMVAGGGTYQQGLSRMVYATANNDYTFTNWTENGVQVTSDADYTFVVEGNRTLVANFSCSYNGNDKYVGPVLEYKDLQSDEKKNNTLVPHD